MDSKLIEIFNNDEFGLLNEIKKPVYDTDDSRLNNSFNEIVEFYEKNKREPLIGGDINEHQLASRLNSLRSNNFKIEKLKEFDRFNLLNNFEKSNSEFKDEFGLLDIDDISIFNIKNIPNIEKDRSDPDFVATRKKCDDFDNYEYLFIQCQKDLKNGIKKISTFVESEMKEGDFFVLNGMLIYIDKIFDPYRGNSNKINKRTRCIYENGMESNILLRSLGKRLSEIGASIKPISIKDEINDDDKNTGYIYVLKSLSNDTRISSIKDLYKIGFSTTEVEERIKNAEKDPTYLMAPVKIVETFKCFNINPQRFERLIHRFFSDVCLDLNIFNENNVLYKPKEWFIVPIDIIDKVIDLIIEEKVIGLKYDKINKKIVIK